MVNGGGGRGVGGVVKGWRLKKSSLNGWRLIFW